MDQGRDIAILKVNIKNAPFLKLADSKQVELLDHITVVGYPGAADIPGLASSLYVASFTESFRELVLRSKRLHSKAEAQISDPQLQMMCPKTKNLHHQQKHISRMHLLQEFVKLI